MFINLDAIDQAMEMILDTGIVLLLQRDTDISGEDPDPGLVTHWMTNIFCP